MVATNSSGRDPTNGKLVAGNTVAATAVSAVKRRARAFLGQSAVTDEDWQRIIENMVRLAGSKRLLGIVPLRAALLARTSTPGAAGENTAKAL